MAEKEQPKEGEQEAPKPKSKKMLFIIIAVVLLLGGGGAAFFLMGSNAEKEEAEKEVEEVKVFKTIKLDPIIVNLSEAKSFLKVAMLIEYDDTLLLKLTAGAEGGGEGHGGGGGGGGAKPPEGGFPPAMIEKEARLKDRIISILSAKTPSDVLSVTGKQNVKDELIEGINEVLEFPEPVVVNIYFTEFIVQ
jgi:flagellar FliL protein